jgi:hypothetical protein
MCKTVRNSTELQYIIELGAQRLMPTHPRPSAVSVAECLRILRGKAKAWGSFKLNVTEEHRVPLSFNPKSIMITHQQLGLSTTYWPGYVVSKVIDLRTCTPEANIPPCIWDRDYASPLPGTSVCSRYIDETQDLMITVDLLSDDAHTSDFVYEINFRTISTDGEHPLAHTSRLELICRVPYKEHRQHKVIITVLGDRIAFYSEIKTEDGVDYPYWSLHVWNWHEGGQSEVGVSFNLPLKV